MRMLKQASALVVLAALFAGMVPEKAVCQAATPACMSPCCPEATSAPSVPQSCPMIQAQAPRDLIGVSSVSLAPTLTISALPQTLVVIPTSVQHRPTSLVFVSPPPPSTHTPQTIPAPPALA